MRRKLLMGALALALALPAAAGAQNASKTSPAPGGPRPAIDIPRMSYDVGKVFEQKAYEYSFVVRNRGNADLLITDVKPTCGCTVATYDKVISPGKEGNIHLSVDGARVSGEFNKAADVLTNDPDHPHLTITIGGTEIPYVNVIPEGTVYMHGRFGEPVEKDLTITSNEKDLDFKITGISSNIDDKITYNMEPGSKPGEYTVKVFKNPKLPSLSTYGSLIVHTNSTKSPDTTLQVHVMTKGSITLSPTMLNFGEVTFTEKDAPATPVTKAIVVTKATGKFQIKEVTVSNPNFKTALEPMTPGQQYRVQVTFTPPARKQSRQTESGEMIVHTDDPQEPALRVQLVARSL
jgi:hypothetical protein